MTALCQLARTLIDKMQPRTSTPSYQYSPLRAQNPVPSLTSPSLLTSPKMPRRKPFLFFTLLGAIVTCMIGYSSHANTSQAIHITPEQASLIGQKIWHNEGLGKIEYLTVWNKGEDFPSLGIGHFLWYPDDTEETFVEQFPQFIKFLINSGTEIPSWLAPPTKLPWPTREIFYANYDSLEMQALRRLLVATIPQQVEFIVNRMEAALPKMLENTPVQHQATIRSRFFQVAKQPSGVYALIDYINFKGEGIASAERYQNVGWGLLQVLENMNPQSEDIMAEFVNAADFVLTQRVKNAPRDESKWLKGWRKRLQTYLLP